VSAPEVTSLGNTVPGARTLAEAILTNPSIQELNKSLWIFSVVETAHLLFLTTLGGATLVLALRVLGVTLTDVALAELERITRPWLRWAPLGGIASGLFMSIATILTLVDNSAFVVKLLGLVAAIVFGFALSGRLRARRPGVQLIPNPGPREWGVKKERTLTTDIGVRASLLDDTLVVSGNIYRATFWDYQQTIFQFDEYLTSIATNGQPVYTIGPGNVPEVRTQGVELQLNYTGIRNLNLRFLRWLY